MRVAFSSIAWNTDSSSPGDLLMTCSTSEVAVCCSSASERCPRASASSRVRASSCSFNSISVGSLPTCALACVPVERNLRPRVWLFVPLRDKVTSSAQRLVPPSGRPSQGSSLSILTQPRDELASPHSITSSPLFAERDVMEYSARIVRSFRFEARELHNLCPLFGFVDDEFSKVGGRHGHWHAANVGEPCLNLGIG